MTIAIPTDDTAFVARMIKAGLSARRLVVGDPETPIRRDAKQVSSAFLELMRAHGTLERLMVAREMPPEEKTCSTCGKVKSLALYSMFNKKRPDGSTYSYPRSQCKDCVAEAERIRYNARPKRVKPPKVVKPSYDYLTGTVEEMAERIVDAAMVRKVLVVLVEGSLALLKADDTVPDGAEIIGSYDAGADYRMVKEDIS